MYCWTLLGIVLILLDSLISVESAEEISNELNQMNKTLERLNSIEG